MPEELKSCPFCGGAPRIATACGEAWIECAACAISTPMGCDIAVEMERWNTRANPAPAPVSPSSNEPANAPTARCPWCKVADVAVESMQCADRIVTGVDEDNGPVYWAECQRCGAQGPIVGWAADAIPKWNECTAPAPVTVSVDLVREAMAEAFGMERMGEPGWTPQKAMHAALAKRLSHDESARGAGDGWKCVSDEPPTDDRECLVFCEKTKAMFVGRMGAGQFEYYDEAEEDWLTADYATHWRELPTPPKTKPKGGMAGK